MRSSIDRRSRLIVPRVYVGACVIAVTAGTALVLLQRRSHQAGLAVLVLGVLALEVVTISGRGRSRIIVASA